MSRINCQFQFDDEEANQSFYACMQLITHPSQTTKGECGTALRSIYQRDMIFALMYADRFEGTLAQIDLE